MQGRKKQSRIKMCSIPRCGHPFKHGVRVRVVLAAAPAKYLRASAEDDQDEERRGRRRISFSTP